MHLQLIHGELLDTLLLLYYHFPQIELLNKSMQIYLHQFVFDYF